MKKIILPRSAVKGRKLRPVIRPGPSILQIGRRRKFTKGWLDSVRLNNLELFAMGTSDVCLQGYPFINYVDTSTFSQSIVGTTGSDYKMLVVAACLNDVTDYSLAASEADGCPSTHRLALSFDGAVNASLQQPLDTAGMAFYHRAYGDNFTDVWGADGGPWQDLTLHFSANVYLDDGVGHAECSSSDGLTIMDADEFFTGTDQTFGLNEFSNFSTEDHPDAFSPDGQPLYRCAVDNPNAFGSGALEAIMLVFQGATLNSKGEFFSLTTSVHINLFDL